MRATTRPGGRPRRPGPPDRIRATGTRRRRPLERRAPEPGPRAAWIFALVALVLGAGFIAFIVVEGNGRQIAVGPDPTATPIATPAPTPTPTAALAVTGDGPGRVEATAGPARTPERGTPAADAPAPEVTPDAGDGRTPVDRALSVEFPQDGDTVVSRRINVFGRAPGGAVVVRELPDGGVAETAARPDGLWLMQVELSPGLNELAFRVQGTASAPLIVRVTYQPR